MCKYYTSCDHDELPNCEYCGETTTLDGHGETAMASLQGDHCLSCYEEHVI